MENARITSWHYVKLRTVMNPQKNTTRSLSKAYFFAILSGAMWAASFPPLPLGFLAFFFLVYFWAAMENIRSSSGAFLIGYIWGFIASAGTLWWVYKPTLPGMIALVLFLPLYNALYAIIYYYIWQRSHSVAILISPILFVAIEYLRSWGILGFPWINISYSQSYYPVLIQFADIVGSFGVSFWIVLINVSIYFLLSHPLSKKSLIPAAVILILFCGALSYGIIRMKKQLEGTPLRIALLQGNIDPYEKWTPKFKRQNAGMYAEMIYSVSQHTDLLIMPETATICYHRLSPEMFSPFVSAVMDVRKPLLTGTLDFDDENRDIYFNTAILIMPDGTYEQSYNKIQLVPFSEQVPLQDKYPSLQKLNFGGSHFSRGTKYTVFKFNSMTFSVLICYESVFGWLSRRFRNDGAQFLVNITNDGWFGNTPGPYQHAMFNVLRAIENRCWIARCANTGISMFIDPMGRITSKTPIFEKAILVGTIFANDDKTVYNSIGDIFGWGALIIAPFLIIFPKLLKRSI